MKTPAFGTPAWRFYINLGDRKGLEYQVWRYVVGYVEEHNAYPKYYLLRSIIEALPIARKHLECVEGLVYSSYLACCESLHKESRYSHLPKDWDSMVVMFNS